MTTVETKEGAKASLRAPLAEPPSMTPDRLRLCLHALGWSTTELARQIGCREELTRRWNRAAPGYSVPGGIAEWLERRAAAALADPAPADWKRRTAA